MAARGATAVTRAGTGVFDVTFDRDVSRCAYQVTPQTYAGFPAASQGLAALDTTDPGGRRARVVVLDKTGVQTDSGFAVQVVC